MIICILIAELQKSNYKLFEYKLQLNCSFYNQMSNWPEITRYSKRSVFLSVPDDIESLTWADQTIHRLGGVKGTNDGEKGWILPKSQEVNFRVQYRLFKEKSDAPAHRTRQSRNPDKKRKRSRVFVRASEHSAFNEVKKHGPEVAHSEDSKNELKPVSYINWEDPIGDKLEPASENEKKHESPELEDDEETVETDDEDREEGDDESSDDELIQAVLARKMKSESSGKLIDTETINDSDEEDCVSYSRRLRHVYAVLANLRSRIAELESKIPKDG